ncbi:MAG: sigma-70 family RNA polymerase sigma factor [bacterium]|nr:sigma-70 family RNA polymerase sigma factor [bacterium]
MTDLEKIYMENFEPVYKFMISLGCDRHTAEDLTQETMFIAIQKIDSFKGKCKLSVWLCQIAKNLYFKKLKEDKKFVSNEVLETVANLEKASDPLLKKKIYELIHNLDEPYREVFYMATFGDLSFKEISSIFRKSESWARVTYHRARLKLKEELKNEI